ncbi:MULTISPECIES: STAS domain-containing protein [Vibrio]|uniref:Anti-anti-sigma factor n=2 Tax=Vibrio genomosp. F10 TaxID=723171 RepID=A0A1B9R334_9VIBR|nr:MULTISPECIES: STAS domain-containing protein [Vibrio]OCH78582.1 anti-anti-sigma factor [Vibrio genomosp. F10]OEE30707.1 anti-anti-sigma factor [Vibrio genomosp. F10 str. ZF-129]OEE85531.1 anti-anti-sigma factor [Vibrio genomosp. F10 str. 9ZD137]OEE96754.1 anti-anti-sigma factor [Vibrio genomosp. F10 str. 9ZC157]OEF08453.1 anti-anti-sigma factor [Vibrio genomosp. F10 str. 9ZB36]
MTVETQVDTASKRVTIVIEGAFGFSLVQDFRRSYTDRKEYSFTVDLRKVDYIDSAGLGMLLNMQNYLGQADGSITLTNTLPQVKKILLISRFDKKFKID